MAKREVPFNNPFADVGAQLKKKLEAERESEKQRQAEAKREAERARERARAAARATEDEASLLSSAFGDVTRLGADPRGAAAKPLPPADASGLRIVDEDTEAYEELVALVEGSTSFDISDSDEFIEGCVEGLDRRVLQKLRRGEYALGPHLDLHGMTREVAREAVDRFIADKRKAGQRCVLIVHGRGLNSKDQIPVLKGAVKGWMERGRIARSVLAFCTARPHDGGAGAVYVLLRR